jgi:hypothetical protein
MSRIDLIFLYSGGSELGFLMKRII